MLVVDNLRPFTRELSPGPLLGPLRDSIPSELRDFERVAGGGVLKAAIEPVGENRGAVESPPFGRAGVERADMMRGRCEPRQGCERPPIQGSLRLRDCRGIRRM